MWSRLYQKLPRSWRRWWWVKVMHRHFFEIDTFDISPYVKSVTVKMKVNLDG